MQVSVYIIFQCIWRQEVVEWGQAGFSCCSRCSWSYCFSFYWIADMQQKEHNHLAWKSSLGTLSLRDAFSFKSESICCRGRYTTRCSFGIQFTDEIWNHLFLFHIGEKRFVTLEKKSTSCCIHLCYCKKKVLCTWFMYASRQMCGQIF